MDIQNIRRSNYRSVFAKFAMKLKAETGTSRGALKQFGMATGVSPRYLSHINSMRKEIGDEVARKIEGGFSLPFGWMDCLEFTRLGPFELTGDEGHVLTLVLRLYRDGSPDLRERFLSALEGGSVLV